MKNSNSETLQVKKKKILKISFLNSDLISMTNVSVYISFWIILESWSYFLKGKKSINGAGK